MKKVFAFLLAFSLLLVSCQSAPADETSSSSDTTEAIQTTDTEGASDTSSTEGETTAATDKVTFPDFSKSWLFSLSLKNEVENPEDYDIALSLDTDTFSISEMPDELRLHIINRTGIPAEICACIHMEQYYVLPQHTGDGPYNDNYQYKGAGWARIPFATQDTLWVTYPDLTFSINLQECLKEEFEYTPGRYRLVVYSGVGTHYANFEITE